MTAPFADAEARVNQAVYKHLANATASIDGGEAVPVIYQEAYVRADVGSLGMASTEPAVTLLSASVPASIKGKPVVVTHPKLGVLKFTAVKSEPDGSGNSALILEKAP